MPHKEKAQTIQQYLLRNSFALVNFTKPQILQQQILNKVVNGNLPENGLNTYNTLSVTSTSNSFYEWKLN